jgi:chemotaxis protein CheX
MALKVEYINPFIEAGTEVLRKTTQMTVDRGKPSLDNGLFRVPDITVVLGLVGDLCGQVLYGFSVETAMGIASRMMGGEEVTEMDDMSRSAIAELGNMITGNAASRFSKLGLNIDVSTPSLITGSNMRITWPLHNALIVPVSTECGEMVVWLSMRERDKE